MVVVVVVVVVVEVVAAAEPLYLLGPKDASGLWGSVRCPESAVVVWDCLGIENPGHTPNMERRKLYSLKIA